MKLWNLMRDLGLSIPFLLMANGGGVSRVNWTRIIEAGIMAICGGALAGYISVAKLEVKLDSMITASVEKNSDQDGRINRLCEDMGRVKEDIAVLKYRHHTQE